MNKSRAALGCGVAVTTAAVALVWLYWSYHRQHIAHARLRLGMTRAQIEQVFGRAPDWQVAIGRASVLVFVDPWNRAPCAPAGGRYQTPRELPWCYSAVQVALSEAGRVSAFVHVGESGVTSQPDTSAATIADLPVEALER